MEKPIVESLSPASVSKADTLNALLHANNIPTLYGVLDVSANSTDAEIHSTVSALRNSGLPLSAEQTYAIQVLGDAEERKRYDEQLMARLSPTRTITQTDGGLRPLSRDRPANASRHSILMAMLCLALAGAGGWSYWDARKGPSKSAGAAGASIRKCVAITVKHYSEEQKQAAKERLKSNRGWDATPDNMADALNELADAKAGAFETISDLLVAGVDLDAPIRGASYPALQMIWYDNHQTDSMLRLFLEHGANIDNPYQPPLVSAAVKGNVSIAQYLIDHCASVNVRAAQGSPDGYTLAKGHTPITAALDGSGDTKTRLTLLRLFLDHGADINQPGLVDISPIHDASMNDLELLKLLIERGAKLDNPSLLYAAINFRREENAIYLIQKGANLSYKGVNGETLLSLAEAKGMRGVAALLREKGIN